MNIIEAFRSGRKMRRTGESEFFDRQVIIESITLKSLLADDWELKPDPEPRMLAWREPINGGLYLFSESVAEHVEKSWVRMPHLDQPEVK